MELHQVAQRAEDLDRAVAFYTGVLGCELISRFDPPGLAFLRLGGTRLLLDKNVPTALLYFRVEDVSATVAKLKAAGVSIDTEPHVIHRDDEGVFGPQGWEERMAFFTDSEGNLVGLASRHAPAPDLAPTGKPKAASPTPYGLDNL